MHKAHISLDQMLQKMWNGW